MLHCHVGTITWRSCDRSFRHLRGPAAGHVLSADRDWDMPWHIPLFLDSMSRLNAHAPWLRAHMGSKPRTSAY